MKAIVMGLFLFILAPTWIGFCLVTGRPFQALMVGVPTLFCYATLIQGWAEFGDFFWWAD